MVLFELNILKAIEQITQIYTF